MYMTFESSKKHEARVVVFQLGAANTSHPCLAIPFVPQARVRGR